MADIKHFHVDAALDVIVELFWRNGFAATGVQDIVSATGLNRSSLYNAFGNKQATYVAALRRYIDIWSVPVLRHVSDSGRGVPAIIDFFDGLIQLRSDGAFAGWGCMITNAHAGVENGDPEVRALLNQHHQHLRAAIRSALTTARADGQLPSGINADAATDLLIAQVYAINLRSRPDSDAQALHRGVDSALASIGYRKSQ
ncbi:TetR/AcrR family transcriptional regulator [Mycolicibacterium sp. CH28]|uniref:TetR/AcrR family transcriptional regulator n=1 Tax=Mycolicibacterium sp. CH28 TaxID=2512237 RepID=UPI0010812638|nr:TetR/AcrR family transcriptional regulator [Mycolicibacterium sp. CH28]TGD86304.1 TetR/AcrR family transcriptional regulator [Mycolicibacterium sp. CH28]